MKSLGGDLLSHPASRAVPSALEGLTSGFGMGPCLPSAMATETLWSLRYTGNLQNYTASACNKK